MLQQEQVPEHASAGTGARACLLISVRLGQQTLHTLWGQRRAAVYEVQAAATPCSRTLSMKAKIAPAMQCIAPTHSSAHTPNDQHPSHWCSTQTAAPDNLPRTLCIVITSCLVVQVLLDIGAGQGLFSLAAAARGHKALAFELSAKSLASLEASVAFSSLHHLVDVHKVCFADLAVGHYQGSLLCHAYLICIDSALLWC